MLCISIHRAVCFPALPSPYTIVSATSCCPLVPDGQHALLLRASPCMQDSDRHSVEGDKRDDLAGNAWFAKSQSLAGDKKSIAATGNWACEFQRLARALRRANIAWQRWAAQVQIPGRGQERDS